MKKLILIFVALSFFSVCFAGSIQDMHKAVIAGKNASTQTDYTVDANCQGAWLFADGLTDESGEGNTLTDGGTVSYTTDRPDGFSTGKSIDFDGSTDYIYIATGDQSASFIPKDTATDFAFCYWAYHDTSVEADDILHAGYLLVYIDYDDVSGVQIQDTNDDVDTNDTNAHALTDWIHVCVSFDGSATELTTWASTDGGTFGDIEDGITDTFTNVNNLKLRATNFALGARYDGGADFYDGHIYQPIIFNRELLDDGSEAEEMYTYGIRGAD